MIRASLAALSVLSAACDGPGPLLSDERFVEDAIPASLTGAPGDAGRGRYVFVDRNRGHCLLCHGVDELDAQFQGDLGPSLSGVGDRLTAGQIRLQIVDAAHINPDTIMPSYYRLHDLRQVGRGFEGAPALSSNEVEDLVAYLVTLTEPDG